MKKDLTEIICIIDRSGSMGLIKEAAMEGFNNFIKKQKELPGEVIVSVVLFNDRMEYVIKRTPLKEIPFLTKEIYITKGGTALNDTLGRVINDVSLDILNMRRKEQPAKVLFCVLTDGEENASEEFSAEKVKSLIEYRKKAFGWEFLFIGANQDVALTAKTYAFSRASTFKFDATDAGIRGAYNEMDTFVTRYRAS